MVDVKTSTDLDTLAQCDQVAYLEPLVGVPQLSPVPIARGSRQRHIDVC